MGDGRVTHEDHDEYRVSDCPDCERELADAMAEYAWMAQAVKGELSREEREEIEADRELVLDEFHGGPV